MCVIHPISINRTWPICRWNFMWLDQVIAIYRWPNPTQMNNKGFYDFCKWNGFACSLTHSFTFCMYVCVSVFILCTCSHKICLLQYIRSVYLVSEVFFYSTSFDSSQFIINPSFTHVVCCYVHFGQKKTIIPSNLLGFNNSRARVVRRMTFGAEARLFSIEKTRTIYWEKRGQKWKWRAKKG